MVVILKDFNMQDCVHYEVRDVPTCCGRTKKAGVCTIEWRDTKGIRTCSTKMKWCKYEKREEDNVHLTELPNPNGRNN